MRKEMKIVIDGEEQNLTKASIDDRATGWYKITSQQWHSTVHLFVGGIEDLVVSGRQRFKDDAEMLSVVDRFADDQNDMAHAAVRISDGNNFIIRIDNYRPCLMDDILTLSHETLHAAQILLYNIGAEVNPAGSETLAYTHQFILGRLISEILKGDCNERKGC